jgi:hypothetical protein
MKGKSIIEIAFDIDEFHMLLLEDFLKKHNIAYYIEPANNFVSLEDVECQCEGK